MPLFTPNAIASSTSTPSTLMVNVKDAPYGAKGDGKTDDTVAIKTAISAVVTLGGGTVFFPAGNYIISSQLSIDSNNITLLGFGQTGVTQIQVASNADPTWALVLGVTKNVQNIVIQGLTFQGRASGSSTGGGINVHALQCDIIQVNVDQFGGTGINLIAFSGTLFQVYLDNVTLIQNGYNTTTPGDNLVIDASVTDCEFHRVVTYGNQAKNTTRHGINCLGAGHKFIDCHAYFCSGNGINIPGGNTGSNDDIQVIGGEYETNGQNGIQVATFPYLSIVGAMFFANAARDIVVNNATSFVIDACQCTSGINNDCIAIFGAASIGSIVNNIVMTSNAGNDAINVAAPNIIVHGNITKASGGGNAIDINGVSTVDVHDNYCNGPITEQTGSNNNNIHDNIMASGTITIVGTNTRTSNNNGYNPQASSVTTPSVPSSTTAIQNTTGSDCMVYILGGTITVIAVGNASGTTVATGLLSSAAGVSVLLKAGQWVKMTYSVAPTWKWFGI